MKSADHRWFEEPNWVTKFNAANESMKKILEIQRLKKRLKEIKKPRK